jgi:hypothetical protein
LFCSCAGSLLEGVDEAGAEKLLEELDSLVDELVSLVDSVVDDSVVDDSVVEDSVVLSTALLELAVVGASLLWFNTQIPAPTGIATIKKSKTKTIVKKSEFPRFCFLCWDLDAESSYSVS